MMSVGTSGPQAHASGATDSAPSLACSRKSGGVWPSGPQAVCTAGLRRQARPVAGGHLVSEQAARSFKLPWRAPTHDSVPRIPNFPPAHILLSRGLRIRQVPCTLRRIRCNASQCTVFLALDATWLRGSLVLCGVRLGGAGGEGGRGERPEAHGHREHARGGARGKREGGGGPGACPPRHADTLQA